jgi:hypothetical protein
MKSPPKSDKRIFLYRQLTPDSKFVQRNEYMRICALLKNLRLHLSSENARSLIYFLYKYKVLYLKNGREVMKTEDLKERLSSLHVTLTNNEEQSVMQFINSITFYLPVLAEACRSANFISSSI